MTPHFLLGKLRISLKKLRFPLSFAVIFMCAWLLAAPVNVNASELSMASALGDVPAVRDLLERGAAPDEADDEGYTPLLRAAFAGVSRPLSMHTGVMRLLIEAGADVNASVDILPPDEYNPLRTVSALHRTLSGGAAFLELTKLLLENGADPNQPGAWGRPLHIAAASGEAGAYAVRLLLQRGARADALNQWGVEALVEAVTSPSPQFEKIALLLEAGSDVNALFDWGGHREMSVLMAVAMNGTSDIVALLLYNGALKYLRCGDGLTAYDYAMNAGRIDNVFALW